MSDQKNIDTILNIFFREPNKQFHLREISRITNLSTTAVSSILNQYKNIIQSEKKS